MGSEAPQTPSEWAQCERQPTTQRQTSEGHEGTPRRAVGSGPGGPLTATGGQGGSVEGRPWGTAPSAIGVTSLASRRRP